MSMSFRQLYELLDAHVEPGTWWPAGTDFEIGVGAILTQNTAWINVEQATRALQRSDQLCAEAIARIDVDELKNLIRPAGFMNAKAAYLKNFATWFLTNHETAHLIATQTLRAELTSIKGVGPETADDMLLYTYDRPVFIWDTYARRMLAAAGHEPPKGYEPTRRALSSHVVDAKFTVSELQRFHGLIVEAGKRATAVGGWATYWDQLQTPGKSR